jgi:predicted alpha/beta hydrolase
MQSASDIFLGWGRVRTPDDTRARDYYFRQLSDWKGSFVIDDMTPGDMTAYARVCGWTLARAHARSGDRVAIAAYLGTSGAFDEAVASFARSYADVNERDYDALVRSVRAGRTDARTGV